MTSQPLMRSCSEMLRVFTACVLAYLMLLAPFAPIAAKPQQRAKGREQRAESYVVAEQRGISPTVREGSTSTSELFLPAAQPQPLPLPPVSVITATKSAMLNDTDGDGKADPGETITYSVTVTNNSGSDVSGLSFMDTIDPHTTLINGSSVLAKDDSYSTIGNVNINVPLGQGVLAN